MRNKSGGVAEHFANYEEQLNDTIAEAQSHEARGVWFKNDKVIPEVVIPFLERNIFTDENGKITCGNCIVLERNPHLYFKVVDRAWDEALYDHNLTGTPELRAAILHGVGEELSHAVPTLGIDAVTDRVYAVAFLYDTGTNMPIVQPFFVYRSSGQNKELHIDVLTCPSITLGEDIGIGDKWQLERRK